MSGVNNNEINQHISVYERNRWEKAVIDLASHLGSGGIENHRLGNGTIPGFSMNDYTNKEKSKLAGIEEGALNNPHPSTHPYTMIEGLSVVGHTNKYSDLSDIPKTFIAGGGDSDTVSGIRFTIGSLAPLNPVNNKDVWFDISTKLLKLYYNDSWNAFSAVYS